jgi:hypothetical protein
VRLRAVALALREGTEITKDSKRIVIFVPFYLMGYLMGGGRRRAFYNLK